MQTDATSVAEASSSDTTLSLAGYLKFTVWFVASVSLVSLVLYFGAYFICVKRIVVSKIVFEPPPLVGTRTEFAIKGMTFTSDLLRREQRLFLPIHEIDKKWLRPKWWTEVPQFTSSELAAVGITQK